MSPLQLEGTPKEKWELQLEKSTQSVHPLCGPSPPGFGGVFSAHGPLFLMVWEIHPNPGPKVGHRTLHQPVGPRSFPKRYLPDKEEKTKTCSIECWPSMQLQGSKQSVQREAVDTISIPYAEQLCMPYAEVTHKSDSVKRLSQLLRSVQVFTNLDTLKSLKPDLTTAMELFLAQFKGLDVHKVTKITFPHYGEHHDCT
ncbi:hypothetical protein DSO57_1012450 [Entomophthora muscae]|uniref:Uncharacterized protein n=1 Tax=Entomophthora muscae TaxID=34485 RepID=A0ACC2S809_9FUNG|nr:hypothetical protein DSO57_1012450 [Entomophthora muscae]